MNRILGSTKVDAFGVVRSLVGGVEYGLAAVINGCPALLRCLSFSIPT